MAASQLQGVVLTAMHDAPAQAAQAQGVILTAMHNASIGGQLQGVVLTVMHNEASAIVRVPAGRRNIHPRFSLRMDGQDSPPESGAYGNIIRTRTRIGQTFLQGTGSNQVEVLHRSDSDEDGQIAASGTLSVDLWLALDPFGNPIVCEDVAVLYIEHKASSSASSINIQASSADGFTTLLSSTAALTLRPGDFIIVGAFTAGNAPVTESNRILDVTNDDGSNAADYIVEVWGR